MISFTEFQLNIHSLYNFFVIQIGGYVRGMLEEMLKDISADGNPEATIRLLKMEIERLQWHHRQEMADLKHNTGNENKLLIRTVVL